MAAAPSTWGVTKIAHPGLRDVKPDCAECLAHADEAITMARVTGSVGATCGSSKAGEPESAAHSATVARLYAVHQR